MSQAPGRWAARRQAGRLGAHIYHRWRRRQGRDRSKGL